MIDVWYWFLFNRSEAEKLYKEFYTCKEVLKTQLIDEKKNHTHYLNQIYDSSNNEFE